MITVARVRFIDKNMHVFRSAEYNNRLEHTDVDQTHTTNVKSFQAKSTQPS